MSHMCDLRILIGFSLMNMHAKFSVGPYIVLAILSESYCILRVSYLAYLNEFSILIKQTISLCLCHCDISVLSITVWFYLCTTCSCLLNLMFCSTKDVNPNKKFKDCICEFTCVNSDKMHLSAGLQWFFFFTWALLRWLARNYGSVWFRLIRFFVTVD